MLYLKNCPCCGSSDTLIKKTNSSTYRAACENCRLSTSGHETEHEAADKWNARITEE